MSLMPNTVQCVLGAFFMPPTLVRLPNNLRQKKSKQKEKLLVLSVRKREVALG